MKQYTKESDDYLLDIQSGLIKVGLIIIVATIIISSIIIWETLI